MGEYRQVFPVLGYNMSTENPSSPDSRLPVIMLPAGPGPVLTFIGSYLIIYDIYPNSYDLIQLRR